MKPIIVLNSQMVLSLQQRFVQLIETEMDFLTECQFSEEELIAAGWTAELIDQLMGVLAAMKEQLAKGGLRGQ